MSSYSRFLDDLEDFYRTRKLAGSTDRISSDEALSAVRDKWIKQGKLLELVSFIHTNWDSGNCDDFIRPFEAFLVDTNQHEIFRLLWTKIIKYRLSALWTSLKGLKAGTNTIDLSEIIAIDVSDFNMFSRDSYDDLKRVLAFRRKFSLDGLERMKEGLTQMNQGTWELEQMIEQVSVLERPKVKL